MKNYIDLDTTQSENEESSSSEGPNTGRPLVEE